MQIDNVLDAHNLTLIKDILQDDSLFVDGKTTAGKAAQQVKNNLQADGRSELILKGSKLVKRAMLSHSDISKSAMPLKLSKIMFNRYDTGMEYGSHIDNAIIGGIR